MQWHYMLSGCIHCVARQPALCFLQERLELLETENDLLLAQQGELEEEIQRLGKLLQDKDVQVGPRDAACLLDSTPCCVPSRGIGVEDGLMQASRTLKETCA